MQGQRVGDKGLEIAKVLEFLRDDPGAPGSSSFLQRKASIGDEGGEVRGKSPHDESSSS